MIAKIVGGYCSEYGVDGKLEQCLLKAGQQIVSFVVERLQTRWTELCPIP